MGFGLHRVINPLTLGLPVLSLLKDRRVSRFAETDLDVAADGVVTPDPKP